MYGQVSSYGVTCFRKTILLTYCEKHKVLLVVLPDAVINPGAVVVHFPYAAFANTEQEKNKTSSARGTMKFKASGELLQQLGRILCKMSHGAHSGLQSENIRAI